MSNPRPRLTFAIPFYQGRQYLELAVRSVLRQYNPNWELIICDDAGSEPDIAELVASFQDRRIRYERNPTRLGMAGNWNRCLDIVRTELVTLLHADDELLENYTDLMLAAAEQYREAAALFCRARIIDAASRPCFSFVDSFKRFLLPGKGPALTLQGRAAIQALLRGDFLMCPTACYRMDRLGGRRFSTQWRMVQDLEFFTRLLLEGLTLVALTTPAYAYRRHPQNATATYTADLGRFREEVQLYDQLRAKAHRRGWMEVVRATDAKTIIKLHLCYRIAADMFGLHFRAGWQKLTFLTQLLDRCACAPPCSQSPRPPAVPTPASDN
ncbi:MAG TPA: glycosyltransferase family 2 protein [Gemmataceae bacterium]|nr:glycosyltransferase family 2 protein [Gemmataceae bacterium]